jgi:hypothetical protein
VTTGKFIRACIKPQGDASQCWVSGQMTVSIKGKRILLRRYAYQQHIGPIPEDRNLRRLCDTPGCYNPHHLTLCRPMARVPDRRIDPRGRDDECWVWPSKSMSIRVDGKSVPVARYAYEQYRGVTVGCRWLTHTCKNSRCYNPAHMKLTSRRRVEHPGPKKPALHESPPEGTAGTDFSRWVNGQASPGEPDRRLQPQATDRCWLWDGFVNKDGYGLISIGGKTTTVHRYSYEQHYGPITVGVVKHTCGHKSCYNPAHLTLRVGKKRGRRRPPSDSGYGAQTFATTTDRLKAQKLRQKSEDAAARREGWD